MQIGKKQIGIKAKIMSSALIPTITTFTIVCSVLLVSLFNSIEDNAKAVLTLVGEKYTASFETSLNEAMDYLAFVSSMLEFSIETGDSDREKMQAQVLSVFDDYSVINGSSIYFEPDMFDGKDAEYIGSEYGTDKSGRICYYFYRQDGKTTYLPEALENDIEFELAHYADAKRQNANIYTEPVTYEINGRSIPMFTLTHPIRNAQGEFIGAVTVDLFLEHLYLSLQKEKIFETGYILIANDNSQVIYSPILEDIGKTRAEAGLGYDLPDDDETVLRSKSILNKKDSLVIINTIYIPELQSTFYISATAPVDEINADGIELMRAVIMISAAAVIALGLLLYFLTGRIIQPIKELTENANRIASGDYDTRIIGVYKDEFADVKRSVNIMADSIQAYIKESKNSLKVLESILDGLDAFIYVTVPQTGEILFVNEQMRKHYNLEGDCVGQYCYKILQQGMDGICDFCPCYELDKHPDKVVVWEEHSTVTQRYYRNTDCYINWLGGDKVHLQHSVDVTDLKMYMNDKLAAEREALDLKNKKEQAEETSRMKSEFLANMSHEIRTPMNAIMGMSELLQNENITARQRNYVNDINTSSHALLDIINDILDFSKIESGKLELLPVDYNFPAMVDNIASMFKFVSEQKGLQFIFKRSPELPDYLYGDDIRLRQVLTNICGNAVKFTNKGYIGLSVEADDETLTFKIEDTGMGIRPEDIDKLFEAFSQADMHKNRSVKGTGLGLAISKSFVEMMDGTISLESEYGMGTTFTVSIPIVRGNKAAAMHNDDSHEKREFCAPNASVLVVDDNEVNLKVAGGLLSLFGIQADKAMTGAQAIEYVQQTDYDIVFMDHMMPEMDGIEATKRIRALGGKYERLTIIALTANAIRGAKEMFLSKGLDGFLSKPIELVELGAMLLEWLPRERIKEISAQAEEAEAADTAQKGFIELVGGIDGINTEVGMSRFSGIADMYQETVMLFYQKLMTECERMESFLGSNNLERFAISIHGMKSSLSTVGAIELSDTAFELESASKAGDIEYCLEHFPAFAESLRRMHAQLAAVLPGRPDETERKAGSPEYLEDNINKLLAAAEDFDFDTCVEAVDTLLEYYFGEQINELLAQTKDSFNDFDFDNAIELLKQMSASLNGAE